MGYIPPPPPPEEEYGCLSGTYIPSYELHVGIECAYCASLNNATKFDNCRSCGAPLARSIAPRKVYNIDVGDTSSKNAEKVIRKWASILS